MDSDGVEDDGEGAEQEEEVEERLLRGHPKEEGRMEVGREGTVVTRETGRLLR